MWFGPSLARAFLLTSCLIATSLASAQELVASGVDGGGASLETSRSERHSVGVGQMGASGALVDSSGRPRWVGGIGGVLAAESVPEPSFAAALPLAILTLVCFRQERAPARRRPASRKARS